MRKLIWLVILIGTAFIGYAIWNSYFGIIICKTTRVDADTQSLTVALRQYKERFGDYPRINTWKALSGGDSKKIMFIDFPYGNFPDPWGTPYEISFSEKGFLIRSAGKDKIFSEGFVAGSDDFICADTAEQDAAANP